MAAVTHKNKEFTELLINKGADLNARMPNGTLPSGSTGLIQAAGFGHCPIIELLLSKGADVNLKERRGHTAFAVATKSGHPKAAKLLADAGAGA